MWRKVERPAVGSHVYVCFRPDASEAMGEVMRWDEHQVVIAEHMWAELCLIDPEDITHVWEWI